MARKRRPRQIDKYAFKQHVLTWADRIGVKPTELHVRSMRNKWASCSTAGRVTFSSDLLDQPDEWREYVIVHELIHLQVPNHGKLFRSLLHAFLPQWEQIVETHQNGLGPHFRQHRL
jgi:predicted metal-dependent hydrolase